MTGPQQKVQARVGELVGWLALALTLAGLAGAWPTWKLAGRDGLISLALAGGATLLAFAVSLVLLLGQMRRPTRPLGLTFLMTSPVRLVVTLALAFGGWLLWRTSQASLLLWVAIFYLALLAAEVIWLTRTLAQRGEVDGDD